MSFSKAWVTERKKTQNQVKNKPKMFQLEPPRLDVFLHIAFPKGTLLCVTLQFRSKRLLTIGKTFA